MSQGKKDKFLPVFFGALGVATLGLGFLGYSASSSADEAEQAYKKKLEEFETLQKAPLSRTGANADQKQELVAAYVQKVKELDKSLQSYQVPEKDITGDAFQRELKKAIDEFTEAAKAKQVTIPKDFDFGMTKYLSTMAAGAAPKLNAQMQALHFLCNQALDAGLNEINALTRQELEFENEKAPEAKETTPKKSTPKPPADKKKAAKDAVAKVDESSVLTRQPVSLTVTGKNNSILEFLRLIANTKPETSPYFFIIRTLKLENESKVGPLKNVDVQVTEKPDPNIKDGPPIKYDAAYVLGNEKVKLQLELDVIRFLPDETEGDKPAGKAANKDAGSTAENKTAGDNAETGK